MVRANVQHLPLPLTPMQRPNPTGGFGDVHHWTFCLIGPMSEPRRGMEDLIRKHGAQFASSVTNKVCKIAGNRELKATASIYIPQNLRVWVLFVDEYAAGTSFDR